MTLAGVINNEDFSGSDAVVDSKFAGYSKQPRSTKLDWR